MQPKQVYNNTVLGPKEEKQFTNSEEALPAHGPLRAAISLLWPLSSLSLPGFPTSSLPLAMVQPLVYAKPQGVLQFI